MRHKKKKLPKIRKNFKSDLNIKSILEPKPIKLTDTILPSTIIKSRKNIYEIIKIL